MVDLASRLDTLLSGWVHPRIVEEADRDRHVADFKLILASAAISLFVLPFPLAVVFSPVTALACGAASSALSLIAASVLCATGRRDMTGAVALILGGSAIALLAAATGGLYSPFVLWAAALPFCAIVAGRSRRWGFGGLVAMTACAAVAALSPWSAPAGWMGMAAGVIPLAGVLAFGIAHLLRALENARRPVSADPAKDDALGHCDLDLLAGLVTLHDPSGNVVAVRGADAGTYSSWLRQPMGQGFFQQIHVADRLAFMQAIDALRLGQSRMAIDLRMQAFSIDRQKEQFVHLHVDLSRMPGGLVMAQSRDVTTSVLADRKKAQEVEAAERANAAKTRFLTAVSHELRTPLNAILGFSEVLEDEYFGRLEHPRQREYVGLIRQSGDHLLSLVNSMLDMSKIEAGRFQLSLESFPLSDAVRRCESMLALQARSKGVLLTSRVARSCGAVTADRRAVDQILINLVANAIKFTEKGGVVTIDADCDKERLILSVADTGIGISAENLEMIGQPFVQLENGSAYGTEGTGLGLSLVKGLVALHEGAFTISSRLGEGTVARVALRRDGPLADHGSQTGGEGAPNTTIDFPPRLSAKAGTNVTRGMEGADDDAQARTA